MANSNHSNFNNAIKPQKICNQIWRVHYAFAAILWMLTFYVMTSVLSYEILSRKKWIFNSESLQRSKSNIAHTTTKNKQQSSENSRRSNKPSSSFSHNDRKSIFSVIVDLLALPLSSTFSFLYVNITMVELHLSSPSKVACEVFYELAVIFHFFTRFLIYVVLWERQRNLHKIKTINYLSSHILRKISLATLFFIVGTVLLSIVVLSSLVTTQSTRQGCVNSYNQHLEFVLKGILFAINIAQQVSIIFAMVLRKLCSY